MFRGPVELLLFSAAVLTLCLVALWFSLSVNRVFDVPKALALKTIGGGAFFLWLLYALFGRGIAWRSLRLFIAPVSALTLVVVISTFLSIDVPTSVYGVYERQFGLQGFLGCVGLFAITATCLKDRRGALAALSVLAILGGLVGTYSYLQSTGQDPYPFFFNKPTVKVYAFLGNATFAGNSLALIFPISTILSLVAVGTTHQRARRPLWETALLCAGGAGIVLLFQIAPGAWAASAKLAQANRQSIYLLGVTASLAFLLMTAGAGSWGPGFMRARTARIRSIADRLAGGGLLGAVAGIIMGLLFTWTRGAWVGSAAAAAAGLALLPLLLRGRRSFRPVLAGCLGVLISGAGLMVLYYNFPEQVCGASAKRCVRFAKTLQSIPAAFDPERSDHGRGQGTRMYLWSEMPRVLLHHDRTLDRLHDDRADYAANVEHDRIAGLHLSRLDAPDERERSIDKSWRRVSVWLFGIGIETYRYAFMSHKSQRLEALDPMTNHDNPHNNYLYVLASFGLLGLAAYLWLLLQLVWVAFVRFIGTVGTAADGTPYSLMDRAIAFGVVTSFCSYAVYSIAGFDSVACSVFLYFLLGTAAVYLEPNRGEPTRPLGSQILHYVRRGPNRAALAPAFVPGALSAVLAVVLGGLLVHAVWGGTTVCRAERAFTAVDRPRPRAPAAFLARKLEDTKRAIEINPYESYYRQSLGSTFLQGARYFQRRAQALHKEGRRSAAQAAVKRARTYFQQARTALYSALHHGWAPENTFISLFQVELASRNSKAAEAALERALVHSPHLGAVRANLALLKLNRKAYDEALADCRWVLKVDPRNATALTTCGHAFAAQSRFAEAERMFQRAKKLQPKNTGIQAALKELEAARKAASTGATGATSGSPPAPTTPAPPG